MAKGFGIKARGIKEDAAGRCIAHACGHHVGFAHLAQVVHQPEGVVICDGKQGIVRDGQGKTGALQKPAQVADFAHRCDAGRQTTCGIAFGLGKAAAQFLECFAPKEGGKQQPIGL